MRNANAGYYRYRIAVICSSDAIQLSPLQPLIDHQREEKDSALLSVVSVSYEPSVGGPKAKLQVAWVPRPTAAKLVKLIRQSAPDT